MKLIQLFTAVSLALSGAAFAADSHSHAHEHKGLQGGVVVEANHLVAPREQALCHVVADEARRARHQNAHQSRPSE